MIRIDARLPVRFGSLDTRRADEAVLLDSDAPAPESAIRFAPGSPEHISGCACCAPRSGAARALADLFRRRAVQQGPVFAGVLAVVSRPGEAEIRTALAEDLLVAARYRLAPSPVTQTPGPGTPGTVRVAMQRSDAS